jgi:hypothetical protein
MNKRKHGHTTINIISYQIHEAKNLFQQYSLALKIFQNSAKLKLTEKSIWICPFIRNRLIKGNQNITLREQDEKASIHNTEFRLGFSESETELRFGTESETERRVKWNGEWASIWERRVSFDLGLSELQNGTESEIENEIDWDWKRNRSRVSEAYL